MFAVSHEGILLQNALVEILGLAFEVSITPKNDWHLLELKRPINIKIAVYRAIPIPDT